MTRYLESFHSLSPLKIALVSGMTVVTMNSIASCGSTATMPSKRNMIVVNKETSGGEVMNNDPMLGNLKQTYRKEAQKFEGYISASDDVLGGTPVITGTRIPVFTILHHLAEGYTPDEIIDDFPSLSEEKIRVALAFATNLTHPQE